jgi:hypothetical protein
MFWTSILFPGELPSIELILETLRHNTGLAIQVELITSHSCGIRCSVSHNRVAIGREDDGTVSLRAVNISADDWYLCNATLAALVSLGGKVDYKLPDWAWKKWGEFTVKKTEFYDYDNYTLTVLFPHSLPTPQAFHQTLLKNTGLDIGIETIRTETDSPQYRLHHPLLDFKVVQLVFHEASDDKPNQYVLVQMGEIQQHYVIESVLAALTDLGGSYRTWFYGLPKQAWQPWEKAKGFYEV